MFLLEKLKEYAKTGRIALVNREEQLGFDELERRSEAFAAYLLDRFGEDSAPVAVYGEKETGFLCCILGALKAGRAYLPIDRTVPPERAARIVEAARPRVVVDFGGFPPGLDPPVLDAAALQGILSGPPAAPVGREHWVSGGDTAYILFTSGSTGEPKGVPITVRNLESFCQGVAPWYPEEGGILLHQVSYSFDVSGCQVYAGLSHGMTLFTVDREMTRDYGELFARLGASGLTMWVSTPSMAELCIQSKLFDRRLLPELQEFLFCGEVLTHTLCDELAERFPGVRVVNTYGPTEATVLVTAAEVTGAMRRDSRSIPIGRPIQGVQLQLAGQSGHAVAAEEPPGELLILGPSVGPGYFGRPDLTGRSFFTGPDGLRGYRTGDLCYRIGDLYYYCGRADNQIKLDGFRIELEDVERNLEQLPNVARAAAVPVWKGEKVQYLAAFVLLQEQDGLTTLKRSIQLKKQAAQLLPGYMIPRKIFAVESFPLNVNGKVDKKALARRLEGETP